MINYRYKCDTCQKTTDRAQNSDSIKKRIMCACGKMARRLLGCNMPPSKGWPMTSSNLNANPDNMGDVQKMYKRAGITCNHDKNGDAILESRGHRNQVLKARGMFDRDAGFGDVTPKTKDTDKGETHEYAI